MKMTKKKTIWMSIIVVCILAVVGIATVTTVSNAAKKTTKKKVLVVYFSATGNTKTAARKIQKAAGADLYEIQAVNPYTAEDIDYSKDNCRANQEQQDETVRPQIKGNVKNIRKYDVIFLGYPIWWGKEPMIVRTFLESNNLKGKKIVTFCTSGGSGISGSTKGVKAAAKGAKVTVGKDLTGTSEKRVKSWVKKMMK